MPDPAGTARRCAAAGHLVTAASRERQLEREQTICGVGAAAHGSAAGWRSLTPPGAPVPLRVPDPLPPGWGLACAGQLVAVPAGRYDWIYLFLELLTAGPATPPRPAGEVWLHYEHAVDLEWLHQTRPGEPVRVPVTRPAALTGLRLPLRPQLRVLAVTLVGPWSAARNGAASVTGAVRGGPQLMNS